MFCQPPGAMFALLASLLAADEVSRAAEHIPAMLVLLEPLPMVGGVGEPVRPEVVELRVFIMM